MRLRPGASAAAAGLMALMSCASRIDEEHFERIREGMSREEVEEILGEPTDTRSIAIGGFSGAHSTWDSEDGATITIQFMNGEVVSKQFFRAGERR